MAVKLSHGDLVAKIAINSKLTAFEVEEALEVLSAVMQTALQQGDTVDLLGLGTFAVENGAVTFAAGESLAEIVSDPTAPVVIERSPDPVPGRVFSPPPTAYSHKVNVNC